MTTPAQPGQPRHARQRATPKAAAANRAAQASASQQKAAARQAGKPKPGAGKPPKSAKRQRAARAARSTRRAHDAAWFAAGPPAVSAAEVQATEYALDMVLGVWAVTKLSKVLENVAQTLYDATMAGLAGFSNLLGAGGGGAAEGEGGAAAGEGETSGEGESNPDIGGGGETVGELEQAAADAGLP